MQESRSSSVQGPSGTFNLFQEGDFVAFPILLRTAFTESLLLFFFCFFDSIAKFRLAHRSISMPSFVGCFGIFFPGMFVGEGRDEGSNHWYVQLNCGYEFE